MVILDEKGALQWKEYKPLIDKPHILYLFVILHPKAISHVLVAVVPNNFENVTCLAKQGGANTCKEDKFSACVVVFILCYGKEPNKKSS